MVFEAIFPGRRPVGRDRELARISALVGGLREGGGRQLVVRGAPGAGKTTLVRWAGAEARVRGIRVLSATGTRGEAVLPFAGIFQLLMPLLPLGERLDARHRRILAAMFGEDERFAAAIARDADDSGCVAAVRELIRVAAADAGVVLGVDDVQWVDPASRAVIAAVARDTELPIALIMAARTGYEDVVEGFVQSPGSTVLTLAPLADAEANALVDAVAGERPDLPRGPLRDRLLQVAAGNPLALVELARSWSDDFALRGLPPWCAPLTERLRVSFTDGLDELRPGARDLVLVTALHSDPRADLVMAAAGLLGGGSPRPADLDAAERFGVRTSFSHPLLRLAIAQSEPLARTQAAHAAIADTIHDRALNCWHRAHSTANPDEHLAAELESHAPDLAARSGRAAAAVAFERAAQLSPDPARRTTRLLAAAEHWAALARRDTVRRLVAVASQGPTGPADRARAELLHLDVDESTDDAMTIAHLCDRALSVDRDDESDLAERLVTAAAIRCWRADPGPAVRARVVGAARALAGDGPLPVTSLLAVALAAPVAQCREISAVIRSVAGAPNPTDPTDPTDPQSASARGMAAFAAGHCAEAVPLLRTAVEELWSGEDFAALPLVTMFLSGALLAEGDLDGTDAVVESGVRLAEYTGRPMWTAGLRVTGAMAAALRGDAAEALVLADELEADHGTAHLNFLRSLTCQLRGVAFLVQGDPEAAFTTLSRVFDPHQAAYHERLCFTALGYLAEAAARCGRVAEAEVLVGRMTDVYQDAPAPVLRAQILLARAVLADDDTIEVRCRAALDEPGLPDFVRARAELRHGQWLRRHRKVADSRTPLVAAMRVFDRLGARPWYAHAAAELGATGERATARLAGAETLSPQESQIAVLAAQGLTNREIGVRLNLAPRTVGSHLYRLFPKLGITSRTQLAGFLDPPRPGPAAGGAQPPSQPPS